MNCRLQSEEENAPARGTSHASPLATCSLRRRAGHSGRAFSLLEVMIASGIFFMCVFAILAMVSSVLRNARGLRRIDLDAGMVAAKLVGVTNKFFEGSESGDFGNLYPDYSYDADTYEVATNGLYQIDIIVRRRGLSQPVDKMSIYVFSPDSTTVPGGRPR